ncbi:MAG: AMP-binding protein [Candidatus Omnitrophota bacterium]|jgi:acyl-CoA synthetase (AMP-forming)/AMP-acid ligase II
MNILNVLNERVKNQGNKSALIFKERAVSFVDLKKQVIRLAAAIKKLGIGPADKMAVFLPNCPEYVFSYLSCFCLGAVVVPLDYMLKEDELISCLSHSEAKLLVALPRQDVSLSAIKSAVPTLETVILLADDASALDTGVLYGDVMAGAQDDIPEVTVPETAPALIMYTSGTTGRPKGILLNYRHLEGSPKAMEYFVDLSARDIKLAALPFSHIAGFIYIQNCLLFGITLIIMDRFNPYEFLKNIERYQVTCFHIVPAMYTALLTLKQLDKFDLSSLRWVVVFGAPSTPEIMARFHRHCPNAKLLNGWGMTETCPPNAVTPLGSANIASVGKPSPLCDIKLVGDRGEAVPPGAVGEIVIRGWVVMDEYYKDPILTAQVKKDGWFYTGDLGRFDEEGFLYIVGRKKEMIKVGGQIVFAPEVEAAFYKHEAVAEVAVVGVADPLRGEAVKAFVVLKDGMGVPEEELRYFARQHLAHFKVPQVIELRDHLPKNRAGKTDKEALAGIKKDPGQANGI